MRRSFGNIRPPLSRLSCWPRSPRWKAPEIRSRGPIGGGVLTSDPFAVYQPASSAVGMYQMTDAALAEAQGYCILHHSVVETGCSATLLHSRVVPRHATELTAVFLDRNLAAILGHRRKTKFSSQQREELAAIIHLCGAGPAKAFARRGFRLVSGERCGDHDVSAYLDQINAMKREFLRFAADK